MIIILFSLPEKVVFCSPACADSKNGQIHRRMCNFWQSMPYDKNMDDDARNFYMCVRGILSISPEEWLDAFECYKSNEPVELCQLTLDMTPAFKASLSVPSVAFKDLNTELQAIQITNAAIVVSWIEAFAFPAGRKMTDQLKCFLIAFFETNMFRYPANSTDVADSK